MSQVSQTSIREGPKPSCHTFKWMLELAPDEGDGEPEKILALSLHDIARLMNKRFDAKLHETNLRSMLAGRAKFPKRIASLARTSVPVESFLCIVKVQ